MAWNYTVLSHFECFSMRTSIVEMKLIAHDSVSEYIQSSPVDSNSPVQME